MTSLNISKSREGINQSGLYFEGCSFGNIMAVNYMNYFQAGILDRLYARQLERKRIVILASVDLSDIRCGCVHEDTITPAFAYVKGFTIPRIDQSIDVMTDGFCDACRELRRRGHRQTLSHEM